MSNRAASLVGLAGRLTDSEDRETYAALVSYVNSLPPGDELIRLMEMLGLLSLVAQRIPDGVVDLLAELRAQSKAAATYHAKVDARLASLPSEIAAGVDPEMIADAMSEAFRQRLQNTGLENTAVLLKASTTTIKALSADLSGSLPVAVSTITSQTEKLVTAASKVEEHNRRLIAEQAEQRSKSWQMLALVALVVFLVGALCGINFCKQWGS